jgi:uncharacterized membrane protein
MSEAKTAKEMYPDLYPEYLRERKQFNADWKEIAQNFCKGKYVPYQKLEAVLKAKGYDDVISTGFTGLIGPDLKLYTNERELIEGVPSASFYPSVEMNENPEPGEFIFRGIKVDGTPGGYFYKAEDKHQSRVSKHSKVRELDVPSIRKKWLPRVKKFEIDDPKCVAATVLELLYLFTARIGTLGNSTYGISTLLVKHVTVKPNNSIILRYKGKDSVNTTHVLVPTNKDHKPVIAAILQLIEDKEPKDPLFTVDRPGGKKIRMYPTNVNKYWHICGAPDDVTVHKIRTWFGTRVFYEVVTELLTTKRPKTLSQAKMEFKAAAEKVGKMLNHVRRTTAGDKVTGVTALNSYIDASLQIMYWEELGYPLPPKLATYKSKLTQTTAG